MAPHNVVDMQFTAVPQSVGAPLRTVTVRDVIADLPAIQNGHDQTEMEYSGAHLLCLQACNCPHKREAAKQTRMQALQHGHK